MVDAIDVPALRALPELRLAHQELSNNMDAKPGQKSHGLVRKMTGAI